MALLLAAAALPFTLTPVFAQDIAPNAAPAATAPVAPPPVVRTMPDAAAPAAAPATPEIRMGTSNPVVQTLPVPDPAAAEQPRPAPGVAAKPRAQAPARSSAPAAKTITAAAPVAEVTPVPPAPIAEPVTPAPAEPIAAMLQAAPPATAAVAPAESSGTNGGAPWPWFAAGAALLVLVGGIIALRRRRAAEDDAFGDEQGARYEAAAPQAAFADPAPAAIAPVIAAKLDAAPALDDVSVSNSDSTEVDAIMATSAPQGDRPWLELMMRPVRAGTSKDDAIVEFELTVGNSGNLTAEDVHISTWMFTADPAQSENEAMMIERPADSALADLSIEPGDGKQVNASIVLPKSGLHVVSSDGHAAFVPVVSAEARYRLPGGGEGRIAASFAIGVPQGDGEALAPIQMDGAPDMDENVEARLYGALERA